MNLKESFIESLKILLQNEPNGRIVENYESDECICTPEDEKTCDQNCTICKLNIKTIVDVALLDVGDGTEHWFRFRNSKHENLYAKYISSYKKMYKHLRYLNAYVIGQEQKDDLIYSKKIEDLHNYANTFFKELCEKCFPLLDSSVLPIRFHVYTKNFDDWKNPKQTAGTYFRIGDQLIIDIYYCLTMAVEDLERNIRHECIHYGLAVSNYFHSDNDAIFWALCKIFDAGAYMEMDQEQQKYYDFFFKIYNTMPSELKFALSTIGSKDKIIMESRDKLIQILESSNKPEFLKDCLDMKNSYN